MRLMSILFIALTQLNAVAGEVNWQPLDFAAAAEKAAAERKLVHIFVEGEQCPPCDAYKATHLADPAYVDFVNSLFVNIRVHEATQEGKDFLGKLNLRQPRVPRFYILDPSGRGLGMLLEMVNSPPAEAVMTLQRAAGRQLPIAPDAAAAVAGRLRAHRAAVKPPPGSPRPVVLAAMEAQAWAFAGLMNEAEIAFGAQWAGAITDPEMKGWYVRFWTGWKRNLPAALMVAETLPAEGVENLDNIMLIAQANAAAERWPDAVRYGERAIHLRPEDQRLIQIVDGWRAHIVSQ